MVHAVLAVACATWVASGKTARVAGWLAAGGGLIFSLALAMIGLLSLRTMGMVAPIGGTLMIAGWIVLAIAAFRSHNVNA